MGKYMRKAKVSGEVAVMEVSNQSNIGVRTRARTLAAAAAAALQKNSTPAPDSSFAYLELRSRRLEKPLPLQTAFMPSCKEAPSHGPKKLSSTKVRRCLNQDEYASPDVEVSFGENVLEAEVRERYVRETTPCSLIRDVEMIGTPGSTTRPASSTASSRRMLNPLRRNIPSAQEMEDFFSGAEQLHQQIFIEKYNFDPVSDHPLPGRYEWVKLDF